MVCGAFISARKLSYVEDIKKEDFQRDDEKQAAILYRIIIIGEATKRCGQTKKQSFSDNFCHNIATIPKFKLIPNPVPA